MRLRNLLLVLLLGGFAAVLPAMASSETTPTVEAKAGPGIYGEPYSWSPTQATVAQGGSVSFSTGSTNAPHGVVWTSSVKPTCTSSVPVEGNSAEGWSGSCTFTQPGVYNFHCAVHPTEMTGTITVTATGATTTTMTPTPAPTPIATTTTPTPTPKPIVGHRLTRAQKLAKALKACKKKPKGKRAACRKQARKRYGPKRK